MTIDPQTPGVKPRVAQRLAVLLDDATTLIRALIRFGGAAGELLGRFAPAYAGVHHLVKLAGGGGWTF